MSLHSLDYPKCRNIMSKRSGYNGSSGVRYPKSARRSVNGLDTVTLLDKWNNWQNVMTSRRRTLRSLVDQGSVDRRILRGLDSIMSILDSFLLKRMFRLLNDDLRQRQTTPAINDCLVIMDRASFRYGRMVMSTIDPQFGMYVKSE
jgi:hypothetical protein